MIIMMSHPRVSDMGHWHGDEDYRDGEPSQSENLETPDRGHILPETMTQAMVYLDGLTNERAIDAVRGVKDEFGLTDDQVKTLLRAWVDL